MVTKEALCIDEMSTVLSRRYRRILDQYPENRAQIYKMIKDTSEEHCNTATNFFSKVTGHVVRGWNVASNYIGSGFSFIYNIPTSGNAQRKGVDYDRQVKNPKNQNHL